MAKTEMTRGNITRGILYYSLPLVLGSLFQLTYNLVDSMILGRFIGKEALAAAGIASPVMNILILGISGLCMGASVLMSEFFGAEDYQRLKEELATVMLFGLLFSSFAALACILLTPPLLILLRVPAELTGMTTVYLRIIFLGVPFTYFYNALAAALKSVGDSKTPLKFLVLSSVLNCILDLVFIGWLGYGIAWSAIATVIAQAVSAVLSLIYTSARIPELSLAPGELRINRELLKRTLRYGSTTALQQSIQPICKLAIQSCVNSLGVDTIAAFNAVTRVDDFAFTPEQSISHGITTFVAQNRGHASVMRGREKEEATARIFAGFRKGLQLEVCYWVLICIAVSFLKEPIMQLFVTEEDSAVIVELGCQYLQTMAFFYLFPAFTNGIQGFFRGCGRMKVTLLASFIQISLRALVTNLLAPRLGMYGISFACVAGWVCMLFYEVPYYFHEKRTGAFNPPDQ